MKRILLLGCSLLGLACSLTNIATVTPSPAATPTPEPASPTATATLLPQVPTITTAPDVLSPILVGFTADADPLSSGLLLGGSQSGVWLSAESVDYPDGIPFWLYTGDEFIGMASGLPPYAVSIQCPGVRYARLSPAPAGGEDVIALGGGWNAQPRPVETLATNRAADIQLIRDHLDVNELTSSPVDLRQVLRVDLDGNGTQEILLVAIHFQVTGFPDIRAGDYSMALILKEDGGIAPMVADYYTADAAPASANRYSVLAVLDLSGDGNMEILIRGLRYEGETTLAFAFDGSEARPVLMQDCGGYKPAKAPPTPN